MVPTGQILTLERVAGLWVPLAAESAAAQPEGSGAAPEPIADEGSTAAP